MTILGSESSHQLHTPSPEADSPPSPSPAPVEWKRAMLSAAIYQARKARAKIEAPLTTTVTGLLTPEPSCANITNTQPQTILRAGSIPSIKELRDSIMSTLTSSLDIHKWRVDSYKAYEELVTAVQHRIREVQKYAVNMLYKI